MSYIICYSTVLYYVLKAGNKNDSSHEDNTLISTQAQNEKKK